MLTAPFPDISECPVIGYVRRTPATSISVGAAVAADEADPRVLTARPGERHALSGLGQVVGA
ncbi:hypothetical protein E1193_10160 [Micromonospora sp. KC606]|uniref:hypothetical protein n=1 Tax=Micromonospora sp. KC606 TaxID=2530379 RepID=UPI001046340A|nr:hypothetical protein [Micromonospora sp. KC606]TDC83018.1 hypothetical protein E1193_10160 [Micromonospora sp. KC606]